MEKLLIALESEEARKRLKSGFVNEYIVLPAKNRAETLSLFHKHRPKVAVLGLAILAEGAGTEEAFRCLEALVSGSQRPKIIVVTGDNDKEIMVRAVQSGAYDFFERPVELAELKVIVKRALHLYSLEEENRRLRMALDRRKKMFGGMIGQCPVMLDVFTTLMKAAGSDAPVLIQGESGTGKELAARAVHALSHRRDHELASINCATLSEHGPEPDLISREADAAGTLFFKEICDLPGVLQARLLGFLQEKTFPRSSGREHPPPGVRILASCRRAIQDEIKAGRFREDLYYRIGVVTVQLPPLRDRKGDVSLLAMAFLKRFSEEFRKRVKGFTTAALEMMESYSWPGNVRELENKVQRAVILTEGQLIEPHDLGFLRQITPSAGRPAYRTLRHAREHIEREMVMHAMDRHKGNIAQAAEELGISRPTFYDIMKKHGLFHASSPQASEA